MEDPTGCTSGWDPDTDPCATHAPWYGMLCMGGTGSGSGVGFSGIGSSRSGIGSSPEAEAMSSSSLRSSAASLSSRGSGGVIVNAPSTMGAVVGLDLAGCGLHGTLPGQLMLIPGLRALNLDGNYLTGQCYCSTAHLSRFALNCLTP